MMGRLRDTLLGLLDALSARRSRRRPRPQRQKSEQDVLKGSMRSVLVVKPQGDIFREAVFILQDDYMQRAGITRQELLRQANEAAHAYLDSYAPPRRTHTPPLPWLLAVLAFCGVLAVIAALVL